MDNKDHDRERVNECLNIYLQDRLKSFQTDRHDLGTPGTGKTAQEERAVALDRYQHRIWQLKDRLSCQVYGPHTEGLVDAFMTRFDLWAEKSSREYLWILRKVLQTEIRLYTILMQRLGAEGDEQCLFERKTVAGKDQQGG